MKIGYASGKLAKICTVEKVALKSFRKEVVVHLFQRLKLLEAYNNLGELTFQAPPLRFKPLSANYAGCFSVRITAGQRIVFRPAAGMSYLNENDVDLKSVTEIEIVAIEDYHDGAN